MCDTTERTSAQHNENTSLKRLQFVYGSSERCFLFQVFVFFSAACGCGSSTPPIILPECPSTNRLEDNRPPSPRFRSRCDAPVFCGIGRRHPASSRTDVSPCFQPPAFSVMRSPTFNSDQRNISTWRSTARRADPLYGADLY